LIELENLRLAFFDNLTVPSEPEEPAVMEVQQNLFPLRTEEEGDTEMWEETEEDEEDSEEE